MTADPVADENRAEGDFNVTQVWLDALSRGTCDEDAFLRAVQMLTRRSPDAAWESLALLDQYHRRGRISPDVFRRVKSRLGGQLLGPALDVERSVPLTRPDMPISGPAPGPQPPPAPNTAAAEPSGNGGSTARTVPIGLEPPLIPVLDASEGSGSDPAARAQVRVGDVLRGRYVIQNVLGLGGTGTVFEAIDRFRLDLPDSGQRVAVKVLNADAAKHSSLLIDLRREFQLLQSLSHPNIVRAHEYDRDGDTDFFTMEYLSGLSLDSVLSAHSEIVLERTHALLVVRDVAGALEHAHSRGVVHGDLNPGNIFIGNDGGIRVLDFGAAHTPSDTPTMTAGPWDATAYATPRYASLQLLSGERADIRDDTYSLACVLYVLLAGKHPFGELNAAQARAQRIEPARPRGLTGKQWQALRAGLAFDRERRPVDLAAWLAPFELPTAEARLPELLTLLKSPPRRSGRGGLWAAVAVLLVVVAAGGWLGSAHGDMVAQAAAQASNAARVLLAAAAASLDGLMRRARTAVGGARTSAAGPANPDTTPTTAQESPLAAAPSLARRGEAAEQPGSTASRQPARPPAAHLAAAPAAAAHVPAAAPQRVRIELAADTVEVPLFDPAAHLLVRRSGSLRTDVGFTWWTESGTAKPGQDFVSVKPHEEHFEPGKSSVDLFVPIVSDPSRKQAKSFYIVINDPSGDASLGKRTLTMVTIQPTE